MVTKKIKDSDLMKMQNMAIDFDSTSEEHPEEGVQTDESSQELGTDPGVVIDEIKTIRTPSTHCKKTLEGIAPKGVKLRKPVMMVTVAGIPARALVDTGSDYSHLSGEFAKK